MEVQVDVETLINEFVVEIANLKKELVLEQLKVKSLNAKLKELQPEQEQE